MKFKRYWGLLVDTLHNWSEDRVASMAAALAYYTIFSLGPLLLISIAIAGLFYGKEVAQGQVLHQFSGLLGAESAKQVQTMLQSANKPFTGALSAIVGVIVLLFGASGLFGEMQSGLNAIWHVNKESKGIWGILKDRFLSFTMVLGVGFLLLVSLLLSSFLTALSTYISTHLAFIAVLGEALDFLVSLGVVTLLFAMIYKILPDTEVAWGDVWLGAFLAAILFAIGKSLLGIYLGMTHVASAYGAASSLIIILIWVYYSAQILFFGAEFTKTHALQNGKRLDADK